MHNDKELAQFDKWGVDRPSQVGHGTDDDIRSNMKSVNPRNWRMVGNQLHADTDVGPLVQTIPTTHIMTGVDKNGLPVFRQV